MSEPFLGEIYIVGFTFPPKGFAACDGQLLPINQNTALFSILGTQYGGNGIQTFALPNLQDRTPLGVGQGLGLTPYNPGDSGGSSAVALTASQLPSHIHTLMGDSSVSGSGTPSSSAVLGATKGAKPGVVDVYGPATHPVPMGASSLAASGSGQPHNNRQPYLGLMFVIALQGIFPSRN